MSHTLTVLSRNSSVHRNFCGHAVISTGTANSRRADLQPHAEPCYLCDWSHISAHTLSNILKFLLPTHFCAFFIGLYRGLWHYSNKNSLPQKSFHAGSVTNIHTRHWITAADIPNTTLCECRWMGHSCPAKCKPVTGIGIPAYHSE